LGSTTLSDASMAACTNGTNSATIYERAPCEQRGQRGSSLNVP
jgi:hypothetical protein